MIPIRQLQTFLAHYKMLLLIAFILIFNLPVFAQKNFISGKVTDTAAKTELHYCIAALINQADSVLHTSVRTNEAGEFYISKIPAGKYTLMLSYPRMADYLLPVNITDTSQIKLGAIPMVNLAVLMQEVIVKSGLAIRMRGDTLEYNADSFALRPNDNVEELLKRLPGIQIDRNGKIIAQGKEVKKILVDGDEFFSDDPGLATQFLKAGAVDKVQVFDQRSDAAQFTGIDDGVRNKTINLKLKSDKKNGAFGKLSAGSDGKNYYNTDAMGALFKGSKKMSAFAMASKTGKEGIANNELVKYVAQDYESIDDGNNHFFSNNEYENENYYGNGLPSVLYGGAHYSDKWKGGKQKLFSNYRIKQINASGWVTALNTTKMPDGTGFTSQDNATENSNSFMQKASGNFTMPVDSFSVLKLSLNGSLNSNTINTTGNSYSKNEKNFLVNNSRQRGKELSDAGKFGANISYQRRFRKEGRTLSFIAQQELNQGKKNNYNYSDNNYFDPLSGILNKTDTLDQLQSSNMQNKVFAGKLTVTEKLTKQLSVIVEYGFKSNQTTNRFNTFNNNNGNYTAKVDTLSNNYLFALNTNITGASFSWNKKEINITVGTKMYFTGFKQIDEDLKIERRRSFTNLAPQANIQIPLKTYSSLSLSYSGQTIQPDADQLQPLRRSSNPLLVELGNPDLQPGFTHVASINYYTFNLKKESNFSVYSSVYFTENNIALKRTTDAQSKTITQYVNLNNVPGVNGSIQYSWRYKKIHLRPSLNLSIGKSGYITILNDVTVKNETVYSSLGSSVFYDLDNKLSVGYTARLSLNKYNSNIADGQSPDMITHSHGINMKAFLPKKIELVSDCNFDFQPANNTFNSSFNTIRWNASVTKKLFKGDKAYVKFSVNDILNNNTGYNRYDYGSGSGESDRLTIKRYFLLTVGWDFSKSIQ